MQIKHTFIAILCNLFDLILTSELCSRHLNDVLMDCFHWADYFLWLIRKRACTNHT